MTTKNFILFDFTPGGKTSKESAAETMNFKLIRNDETSYFESLPTVRGALDYRLYEWSPVVGDWIQIDGKV